MRYKLLFLVLPILCLPTTSDVIAANTPIPPPSLELTQQTYNEKPVNLSDLDQKQCVDKPRKTCITPVTCPSKSSDDLYHFRDAEGCLAVEGDIMEIYAPTPSSEAARIVSKELAKIQIPKEWIRDGHFDGGIKANVDTGYFGKWADRITGRFVLGDNHAANLWEPLEGPFRGYQDSHGLSSKEVVHTHLVLTDGDMPYHYTLYTILGTPITKNLSAKEAYYLDVTVIADQKFSEDTKTFGSQFLTDLKQFRQLDGYVGNKYTFYCLSNIQNAETTSFNKCKGNIFLAHYVSYEFELNFEKPIAQDEVLAWFNQFHAHLLPTALEDMGKVIKAPDNYFSSANGPPPEE